MTLHFVDAVHALLVESLGAWGVAGNVARECDGKLVVTAAGKRLLISRAPSGLPFRWMIEVGDRTRGVTSVSGLLRNMRAELDTAYRPARLRVAPLPISVS